MKKILVLTVLALSSLTACAGLGTSKDETIDVGQLQREYMKSKADTRTKYNGKEVTILGAVLSQNVYEDKAYVHIGSQTDSELAGARDVSCEVDKEDLKLFSGIREKQAIKVKGTLSVTDNEMALKNCKQVPF